MFSDITSGARPLARLGTSKKVIEVCSWYAGPYLNILGKTELDVLRFLKRVLDLTTLARTSFWQFVVEGYERVISLGPTWWDKSNSGDVCIQCRSGFEGLVRISEEEKGQTGYIVLIDAEHKRIAIEQLCNNDALVTRI